MCVSRVVCLECGEGVGGLKEDSTLVFSDIVSFPYVCVCVCVCVNQSWVLQVKIDLKMFLWVVFDFVIVHTFVSV